MIDTVIKQADIYRSGCIVRRQGTVHLLEGTQSVRIGGLNAPDRSRISPDSVRLYVPEGVKGDSVQVEVPGTDDIDKANEELADRISRLEDEIEALDMQRDMWTDTSHFSSSTALTAEGLAGYIEKLPDRLGNIYDRRSVRSRELSELKKQYDRESSKCAAQYIAAELTAEKEGDYTLEISYFVTGVWWYPFYEIHTEGSGSDISIRLRAKINQKTGEDWSGVKLSLYSSDPSISGSIPVLRPNYLSFERPVMKQSFRAINGMAAGMSAAMMQPEAMAMEEADEMMTDRVYTASASVRNDETAVEYMLGGTWNISSGKEIIADLTAQDIKARFHDITIPKADPSVFLAAEVAVSDIEELYETEAAVYIKGAFMGNVSIDPDLTKDTYDISLGKDETIKAERKQVRRYSSNVLLKGQRKTELEYEITVTSRKPAPAEITVIDQVPVAGDKGITVEAADISGAVKDETTGELRWEFTLGAGEKAVRKLAYSVTYPKDQNLKL